MRYIDADKLIAHLKDEIKGCEIPFGSRANGKGIAYGTALGLKSAISFAETLTTADVVPKSEVKKIFKEFERLMENNEVWFGQTDEMREEFAELKKKYTEETYAN